MSLGPALDARRARVAAAGLTGAAVTQLTPIVRALPLEALGPVKQLLKRFFSDGPWIKDDDDALADAVGERAGADAGRYELETDLVLAWGWQEGRFWLRLVEAATEVPTSG